MRIVIDTNVLIGASWDDASFANKIVDEVIAGRLEAYANYGTRKENRLLVSRAVGDEEYQEKLEEYFDALHEVGPLRLDVVEADSEDNKILGSAVAAGAEYLITSDRDLLQIEEYEGIKILTPGAFWTKYREETSNGGDWKKFIDQFLNDDQAGS